MLARVLSTKGGISKYLDEAQLMEMPQVRKDHSTMWKEYQAVWRKNRIELYESYVRFQKTSRRIDIYLDSRGYLERNG